MAYENAANEKLIKAAALKFLGDEKNVHQQFLLDTMKPRPPAPAPPILFEVLDVLYQNSQLIYEIFASIVISAAIYYLGRRDAKRDREQLISKIKEVLREKQQPLNAQVKANRRLQSKLRWNLRWRMLADKKWKFEWEIRLKIYSEKTKALLDEEKEVKTIMQILDELNQANPEKHE